MTKVGKSVKLIVTLVLLVLAFFCSLSITNSYFTASSSRNGTLNFPLLDVRFVTLDSNNAVINSQITGTATTITLYPIGGSIPRGETFSFALSDAEDAPAVNHVAIKNMSGSCEVYVRFWIDAYTYTNNTLGTTNYGQYFLINYDDYIVSKGGIGANATETSWCYFATDSILEGQEYNIASTITVDSNLPDEVLGQQLKITMTLEAVQAANNAFLEEFGDSQDVKGYCSEWVIE